MAIPNFDDPDGYMPVILMDGHDPYHMFGFGGTFDWHAGPCWLWHRYNVMTDPQLCAWLEWEGPLYGDALPELGRLKAEPTYLTRAPCYSY